jgi:FMN-dependent NADH-azoreductase
MIRIACTALAKRIMAGRVSKDGIAFIGKPQDVTSDALKALIEFIGINETHVITVDGKPMFEISVHQVEEVQS